MLRGRASHHVKIQDTCVSICDNSLTEIGKSLGPVNNLTLIFIITALHLQCHSILFSFCIQDPNLPIIAMDAHPQQHLTLLITVPPTLQRLLQVFFRHQLLQYQGQCSGIIPFNFVHPVALVDTAVMTEEKNVDTCTCSSFKCICPNSLHVLLYAIGAVEFPFYDLLGQQMMFWT